VLVSVCLGVLMCSCVYVWVFLMCLCVCVCVGFVMCGYVYLCGCFDNYVGVLTIVFVLAICVLDCVLGFLYFVRLLFLLCIYILICYVCTNINFTATTTTTTAHVSIRSIT